MRLVAIILVCVLSSYGCASRKQVTTSIAVPIKCAAVVPERPLMPLEGLVAPVALDTFVQAAIAEVERREGYEIELNAALKSCL